MTDADWEQQFEERVARERRAMIDLLDASRALTGAFRPSGMTPKDAADAFASQFDAWRAAADAVTACAEARLGAD
jgi:hypothetical protein